MTVGITKAELIALFEEYLNIGKPEQMAAYRDDNPILKEVLKVFNKTIQTYINGLVAQKSMLNSNDKECDRKAIEKANDIMKKAFDGTTECLIIFRQRIRAEVNSTITDIREVINFITEDHYFKMTDFTNFVLQVPDDQRASLILPVDECFEQMKTDTFEKFGHNIAEHIVCSKKIKN